MLFSKRDLHSVKFNLGIKNIEEQKVSIRGVNFNENFRFSKRSAGKLVLCCNI